MFSTFVVFLYHTKQLFLELPLKALGSRKISLLQLLSTAIVTWYDIHSCIHRFKCGLGKLCVMMSISRNYVTQHILTVFLQIFYRDLGEGRNFNDYKIFIKQLIYVYYILCVM